MVRADSVRNAPEIGRRAVLAVTELGAGQPLTLDADTDGEGKADARHHHYATPRDQRPDDHLRVRGDRLLQVRGPRPVVAPPRHLPGMHGPLLARRADQAGLSRYSARQ